MKRIHPVVCWCSDLKGRNERIKNGILGRAARWGCERAPACFHVHTRGHTSVETMCLEVLIADVILICTHPRRHTRQGLLLRSRPLCDIWKGQVQHHSNAQAPAHVRTLWPGRHQVSAWARTPHGSSIRRLTSETRISLLPQGLDSKHSFQPVVSQSFGAATQTAEARCRAHRHAQTDTPVLCTHDTVMSDRHLMMKADI